MSRGDGDTRVPVARVAWRLIRRDPRAYLVSVIGWSAFHMFPLPIGWAFKVVLDRVTHGASAGSAWGPLVVLCGLEVTRWTLLIGIAVQWTAAWFGFQTVPRVNAMESLACAPGPAAGRLPGSPGEAVSRFRDDTLDMVNVIDAWLDVLGASLAVLVAVVIMVAIDARVTVAVVAPAVVALVLSQWLGPRLREWRLASREAAADVTGFIGDAFGAVLAIKAAGAESAVSERFRVLNEARARVARRDQVGSQLLYTISGATGEIGIGLLLFLVAGSVRSGAFTVGDLGLFASYMTVLTNLPRWAGRMAGYHRQAEVSIARLAELLVEPDPDAVVAPVTLDLRHGPARLAPVAPVDEPFTGLSVRGLCVRHAGGRGVDGADLDVGPGELVVLTGPVGGGKSSLVRAVLGLVPTDAGEVRWNGRVVAEPSVFMVPPRVAYLPQVPRLFSEPLRDTVLLGLEDEALEDALWQACMEDDVADMPHGLDTMVGPRGVRLSGGQLQRTAAARALVRRPQLLVVDDLSSALDVETESRLWDRLLHAPDRPAVLVVSHRPRVLAAADRVVVLDNGGMVEAR
jgi:ATP-binding cassette subfamily B protein